MEKRYPLTLLAAATLPLDENHRFDEAVFRKAIKNAVSHGVQCMYTFGTAGEGYAVSTPMFGEITKVFLEEFSGEGRRPMVGVLGLSVYEMLERIEIGYRLGARDFQIGTPAWGALTEAEVTSFFHMICDRFPDCSFMHYNNGPRSKTKLTIGQYVALAKEIPNLVAAKCSTMNMAEIRGLLTADCPIAIYMVDNGYCYGAMVGDCGYLASFCELSFPLAWKHFRAGREKDCAVLLEMDEYLTELGRAFSGVQGEKIDAAYDKTIAAASLPGMSQRLYPPYLGLTDEEFEAARASLLATVKKYGG